ncbi:uncharacterized protein LOC127812104 [Diospyros lotus]|uniref:uncharacterized protein LOC127812104 n=1 Tax=Diospyros lotus TaxID=55363 RepID=UPI002255B7DE|nr:uncharacterized protein LOC127812104 [Diospyros lotus]
MSVPEFGGWDRSADEEATNYSVVFSQARANRKEHKSNPRHASLGNEQEILIKQKQQQQQQQQQRLFYPKDHAVRKKKGVNYFSCCFKP